MKINVDKLQEKANKIFEEWPELDTITFTADGKPWIRHQEALDHQKNLSADMQFLIMRHRETLLEGELDTTNPDNILIKPEDFNNPLMTRKEDILDLKEKGLLNHGQKVTFSIQHCNYVDDNSTGSGLFGFIREAEAPDEPEDMDDLQINKSNLAPLIKAVFTGCDLGAKDIKDMMDAAKEEYLYPSDMITKDDYITKVIIKAIEPIGENGVVLLKQAEQDISYAINELIKVKQNMNKILNVKSYVEEKAVFKGYENAEALAEQIFGKETTDIVFPIMGWHQQPEA